MRGGFEGHVPDFSPREGEYKKLNRKGLEGDFIFRFGKGAPVVPGSSRPAADRDPEWREEETDQVWSKNDRTFCGSNRGGVPETWTTKKVHLTAETSDEGRLAYRNKSKDEDRMEESPRKIDFIEGRKEMVKQDKLTGVTKTKDETRV